MTRVNITVDGAPTTIPVERGETLLEAIQRAGWHFPAPCGGHGRCGKCVVTVDNPAAAGERHPDETRWLGEDPERRLACRCVPVGDLAISVMGSVKPSASPDTLAKGGGIEIATTGSPAVTAQVLSLEEPTLSDQRSLHRRLADLLELGGQGADAPTVSPEVLRKGSALYWSDGYPVTVTAIVDSFDSSHRILDLRPGEQTNLVGLAVDVGTTTVAAYLVDLADHEVIASLSAENAQATHGADVISRIHAAANGAPLTRLIRDQVSDMTVTLARETGMDTGEILAAAVVGNTTMMHLLLGLDPGPISRAPFTPVTTEPLSVPASAFGWPLHDESCVRVLPGVSGYVGADIVADLLACELEDDPGPALLIDIGTNGEIVLKTDGRLICCSTAAGPAFEGASIRHGLGGVRGAINHVRRQGPDLEIRTIGDQAATGICGTGLMDAVAQFLEDGLIDDTGRLEPAALLAEAAGAYKGRLVEVEGEPAVTLDGRIVLTQGDIRQVQLAKAAIAAGVVTLCDAAAIAVDALSTVYLAGGFGTYVRPDSAVRIGLLPRIPLDRIVSIGNAAGAGAARALVDRESMHEAAALAGRCRYVELSGSAVFQTAFVDQMMFPG